MSAIGQLHVEDEERVERRQTEQKMRNTRKMDAMGGRAGRRTCPRGLRMGIVFCRDWIPAGFDKQSRLRRFAEEIGKAGEQGAGWIEQLMAASRQRAVEACRPSRITSHLTCANCWPAGLGRTLTSLSNLRVTWAGEDPRFSRSF
jgi:hypothetical protein